MATVICAQCGISEEYDLKPGFPRKYCSKCSAARKAAYDSKQNQQLQAGIPPIVQLSKEEFMERARESVKGPASNVILNKTEKPNSYEFGPTGDRFKIYFDKIEDLRSQMDELRTTGMIVDPTALQD